MWWEGVPEEDGGRDKILLKEDISECGQIKSYLDERSGVDKMMRDGKAGRFEVGRRSSCERA